MHIYPAAMALFLSSVLAILPMATPAGADSVPAAATTAQVVEGSDVSQWGYTPQSVTLAAGQRFTWTNIGQTPHSATEDTGAWDTGLVMPGASGSITFGAPGIYAYHCTLHTWMKGTVVVTEADQGDAGRTDVAPTDAPD